ncbi:MAG TPA: TonB-dependent receptor [Cyclobacteriaceae bacterium]|nr:TonB-dependent receptor [Cyclobacteriaceae bacterium]
MIRLLLLTILTLILPAAVVAQTVTGKVTSASEPNGLPGVSIQVKGTSLGSLTDMNGDYSINAPANSVLVFSFVGYETQEITYNGEPVLNVVLVEKPTELDEIIVVGYSATTKRDITGSIASIKSEKFKDISINGVDQALQGQIAGVQVTQSSGTPGGGIAVRIRGVTSISAGNRPLFIVDGIPVETGVLSGRDYGGQTDNALSLINPSDIESMEVLKDASAKAVYGSRASNGVVLIKTKRGNSGAPKINFDVQRGVIQPVKKLELLNATQLLDLQREAVTNAGENPDAYGLIPGVTDAVNTDWQDEVLRTGILQQYQLSVTGGDDNTMYYISGSYRDEEGVQLNNKFTRMSLAINLDQKLTDRLSLGTNFTLSKSVNHRVKGDNFLDGVYSGAVKSLPYFVPYDENGYLVGPGSPLYAGFPNFNPVGQALLPRFDIMTVKLLGGINASYSFSQDLKLKAQVSLDYNNITEDNYESSQTAIGGFLSSVGGQGYGIYIAGITSNVNSFLTLTYSKKLSDRHQLNAVLGTEVYQSFNTGGSVQGRLFPSDDFTYINSAGIVDAGGSLKSPPSGLVSFFGEASYDYDDRYLAKVTMRADGSSNFGPNNKFGFFPAISAGWRISSEKFFPTDVVSDLKLRASYGLTGNERIGAFQYLATWGSATYNGSTGVSPNNVDNPDIKWETTREINVGVDAQLWAGRMQTTFDVYHNKTSDLLLVRPYPTTTGFGGIIDNIGDMQNKGIELSVTSVNIDKNLRWTTTLNLSRNLNEVLFLADSIPLYRGYTGEGVDGTNIIKEGEPLGTFWGLNFLGVDPATGDAIYEDRNLDGAITNEDAMVIGNSQPKLFGGITNTLSYKGFDLSIFFQFSVGNKVLNLSKATFVNMGADIENNQSVEALRRWREPGDITDVPRYELGSTLNNLHSNRLLEDGSYLRLKNVSLGYNFPAKITNTLMLKQLRLYVTGTNIWTYTKYSGADPEVSTLDGSTSAQGIDFFTLPQVKTLSVGLNATLR